MDDMHKGRMEAFSDGVLAILITIMVLELKIPREPTFQSLELQYPLFLSYALSFTNLAIYWNNHHHMLQAAEKVTGAVLWANMHLLFWLSLIPFTTAWLGENGIKPVPVAVYAVSLILPAIAYYILTRTLISANGKDSTLARALGNDFKGKISVLIYGVAIALAFLFPLASCLLILAVALIWLVPDPRFERELNRSEIGDPVIRDP